MDNKEFMEAVKRTWKNQPLNHDGWKLGEQDNLTHALMGLSAEAGELMDEFKKWRFYHDGRSFPQKRMEEELGDVFYYAFAVCLQLGVNPEYIMGQNKIKLRERYGTTNKLPPNCS